MLSNHAQSMFEYLAPRRGGGGGGGGGGAAGAHNHHSASGAAGAHQGRATHNDGFKDMVY